MTTPKRSTIPECGKGTFNGAAAEASKYGFAPCVRPYDHPNLGAGCDSGPAPEPQPVAA
jgi:hypothetical protein